MWLRQFRVSFFVFLFDLSATSQQLNFLTQKEELLANSPIWLGICAKWNSSERKSFGSRNVCGWTANSWSVTDNRRLPYHLQTLDIGLQGWSQSRDYRTGQYLTDDVNGFSGFSVLFTSMQVFLGGRFGWKWRGSMVRLGVMCWPIVVPVNTVNYRLIIVFNQRQSDLNTTSGMKGHSGSNQAIIIFRGLRHRDLFQKMFVVLPTLQSVFVFDSHSVICCVLAKCQTLELFGQANTS